MKSSIKLHPGRWALGLIALMTMALVACGGAEAPTAAPTVPTPTVVDVIPAVPAIKDTPVPQAQATEAMAATEVPAAVSARDTVHGCYGGPRGGQRQGHGHHRQ